MQFAVCFQDIEIVVPLARQLSWSHFLALIPLKSPEARLYYARRAGDSRWSKRKLRYQIERKAFERSEIADTKLALTEAEHLSGNFKDPCFLDFLGLKDSYLENELESALLKELELFILELGKGFAFVERQKRMIIDGEDFYLDLLFYHRKLKGLVAIDLKIDRFKAWSTCSTHSSGNPFLTQLAAPSRLRQGDRPTQDHPPRQAARQSSLR